MFAPVFDLHCDSVLKLVHRGARFSENNDCSHVDIPKMKLGNVNGVVYSLWADPAFNNEAAVSRTQYMLERAIDEIKINSNDLFLATGKKDLKESIDQNKITVVLGIEGGRSINNSLKNLENFRRQGVCRMILTHTSSTDWAGSATDEGKVRGLSDFGKSVVLAMNDLGMIVDVAHTSERTFLDAVKVSKKPVVCSHSLSRKIMNSGRLATDEMILALGRNGGLFGVTFLSTFFPNEHSDITKKWMDDLIKRLNSVGRGDSLEEMAHENASVYFDTPPPIIIPPIDGLMPHLDHVINLIGEDHIGIGSDFDGIPFGPGGLENAAKYDNLRSLMLKHGYSETRISKILGGNARRILSEILD